MKTKFTESDFLKEVRDHEMIIIKDDGAYRHVRFKKPGTTCMHFDLITWPGYLCYTGDMGTYIFSRLRDMFEFFRTDREYNQSRGRQLGINLSYWAEKAEAKDRHSGIMEFSEDLFNRAVTEHLVSWIRENAYRTTKEERRELWDAVMIDVIGAEGDSGGFRKQIAVNDFSHYVNEKVREFYFQDFWEHTVEDYTHRFVWCCYALAWGIQQYDNAANTMSEKAGATSFFTS